MASKWHKMKLEIKGKTFVLWLNQQKILVHKDEAVKKGKVGLSAAGYTARFDNVEISGSEAPDFTPLTWKAKSIDQQNKLTIMWSTLKGRD